MNVFQEAERIKNKIRICLTREQVASVVDAERGAFQTLKATSADGATMAIQIQSLKTVKLSELTQKQTRAA